jgi:flagellar hook-associated protein 2
MTNSINLAALGFGGIDTSSLVTSLVSIESQPLTTLQTQQQNIQSASSTISGFASLLNSLGTAITSLSDPGTFSSMGATSSDPSIVATTSGSPPPGQWSVSVSSVAQQQRTLSNGISSATTALGLSGTLGIALGNGTSATIDVSSSDSLSDIANAISSAGLRVQASVIYDGSQYHLLVSGLDTGSSNAISFDESGLSGSGYSLGLSTASNTIQQAQNANVTVGGIAVTSATNQISNAIPGVTLAVTQPTTSAATLTVSSDPSSLEQQVQAFVTAYNNVVTTGHTDAGYGTTTATNSLLQNDDAVQSTLDQLGQVVAEQVPGSTGAYTSLASVGITLNDDGTLSFDQGAFAAALQADPTSVQRLFVTDPNNGSTGVMGQIDSLLSSITDPTNGAITAELNGLSSRNTELTSQIGNMQQQVNNYQTQLQNEFTQMNAQLAEYKQIMQSLDAASGTASSSSSSSSTNSVI